MKKHLLVFFIPFFLFAQKNSKQVDLLVMQSDSCFKEMNYKCALEKVEKAEKIVPNNINQRHLLATKKAACYTKLRQFDLAIQTLEQIKLSNPQDKAALENYLRALNIRANIHYSNYEDEFAIKKYLQIDSICSTYNHISETQIKALQNIGLMFLRGYEDGKKPKHLRARDFFTAAYEKADKANFMVEKHMAGLNLGSTFLSDSIPSVSKALTFYKEAEVYFEKNQLIDDLNQVYWAYASLYTQTKAYDKAAFYHQKKINNMLKSGNQHAIGTSYWSFAGFFMDRQLYRDAIENYQKAIESLNKVKDKDYGILASCYYYCAEAHAKLNEDKKAYHYLIDYLVYKDSVDIKQNQIAFNDLETKYQTQKKEQEIALLTAQNQIAEKQKYIYIALAGLLLLAGLSLFFGYRNKIKTAQKLNELNELKSRFFANISHEFRTPLTLIKSPVQQLQNTLSDENQKKQLRLIDNNANRMLELVDQLLELSKIDSGQLKIILKKGNLHHFFQAILEPFSFKAKEDHQRLTFSTENLDFETYFDRDIVTKITSNLVDNALKYNEAGKPIEFIATQQNQHLLLKVSNYNNQLSETDYQKLFDRFYQKNNAVSGFGIGLALVKDLVELYEGTITTDFNQGKISFTVELPLQKELTHALVITEDAEIKKETLTEISSAVELPLLLVVDDNASIREVYQDLFKDHFQILEASTGKEALLLAQKEIPDCIISDVMMPEMDGFTFTNQIKTNELTSFIPVILVTAKSSDDAHLNALQNTADAFLTKPFNHDVLKATVWQQIQERKKLQERYSQELVLKPTEIIINTVDEKFIAKLEKVLDGAISNSEFNAETFANQMHMSRMQLHRKLKSLFGVSATEFIRNERLKMAADLLQNNQLSISEIAYHVGFNDLGYFSKCFKEMYHVSPSDYQKK